VTSGANIRYFSPPVHAELSQNVINHPDDLSLTIQTGSWARYTDGGDLESLLISTPDDDEINRDVIGRDMVWDLWWTYNE